MVETLIRAATPQDVDAIVALHRAFHAMHVTMDPHRWTTATPPADVYPTWIASLTGDAGLALVATAGGRVVGYLIAEYEPESTRHWSPACVYFHDLFVAPTNRRSGVARQLIEALLAWRAKTHPTLPIRLTTAANNEPARRFFASLGFRAAAVEMIR
jgi:GNAT superfamily N-acetyltransferase